ncbi:hypothetical protein M422DRAFT_778678 [Sphaerobolus stellatus SS14]|uniref:Fungal-type protein kinase domain-containing protein n=1 Tax=Sphaerobolus stellatus (strain SS14) TaxID=990650 RepID=A0A0C9VG41_SPHS4|nr:hypothetical protein M422DRAFT_778678 [Sphaerobolus stellatus SS14]
MFTVTDTDKFLETILPVHSANIDAIYQKLLPTYYSLNTKKWKGLSKPKPGENELYDPFVKIAKAINEEVKCLSPHSKAIAGQWVNCSSMIPKSKNILAPAIRPDVAFVAKVTTRSMAKTKEEKEKVSILQVWWLHMLGFGEFKVSKTLDEMRKAVLQLANYVKQAFHEQLDRRFIIGFTLCLDKLNIYLFDRSGVVGTHQSINIHKNPTALIRLLAGYSMLSAEQLGWDPTMQLFSKQVSKPLDSYKFSWPKSINPETLYDTQWVIKIADEDYITIRALSITDAEIMCERATVIWEVVPYKDFSEKKLKKVFVLKQSWQRLPGQDPDESLETQPFEHFALKRAGYDNRLHKAEYVMSDPGQSNGIIQLVSTLRFIRHDLAGVNAKSSNLDKQPQQVATNSKESTHHSDTPASKETFSYESLFMRSGGGLEFHDKKLKSTSRIQTRILMDIRGWPIKYFKDLKELLRVFKDAVTDHSCLYYANVKPGIYGCLIDLDHAKVNKKDEYIDSLVNSHYNILEEETKSQDEIGFQQRVLSRSKHYVTRDSVLIASAAFVKEEDELIFKGTDEEAIEDRISYIFTQGANYLRSKSERYKLQSSKDKPLGPKDFSWDFAHKKRPVFDSHKPGDGFRTGTLPYMSHDIVSVTSKNAHDSVHDIESFFWVLIHIALIRGGPGGVRRIISNSDTEERLNHILTNYFDSEDPSKISAYKWTIFAEVSYEAAKLNLEEDLLNNFDPYFDPLKPFIREWWSVLKMAYEFKAYELWNIHDHTQKLFEEAIENLGPNPHADADLEAQQQWAQMTENEVLRRKKYQEDTKNTVEAHTFASDPNITPDKRAGVSRPQDPLDRSPPLKKKK